MTTKNIVFIDSRVSGYETLTASLGADTVWYLLDAFHDGVDQMQRILADYSDLNSLHFVSHGSVGTLYLGSTVLNSDNLFTYRLQLQAIGASLAGTGDILLYGCNVALGDAGVSFVNSLAQITGADVAASDDETGTTALKGNWVLENRIGTIDVNGMSDTAYSSILSDDYAASTATTGTLSVGGTNTGSIEYAGDYDWFKVTLSAGVNYQFEVLGLDTSNGTLADPYLELYSGSGVGLAYDDDNGTGYNSSLYFSPSTSGTYFLVASEASDGYTGTYTVKASTVVDDYAAATATAGTLFVGGTNTGSIEYAGDYDWFKVYFTAGNTYTINLKGSPSFVGTLADPIFDGVYDALSDYLDGTGNDDYGPSLESQATFTPTSSGYYYLSATSYGSNTGTYQFSVSEQINSDLPANTTTTAVIALNESYRSQIFPSGDIDWVKASLTAGTSYVIELNADNSTPNPLYDPNFVGIYDSNGVLISGTSNDDYGIGTDSRVTFTPSASGNYYLAASGYGINVGAYQLRLLSASNSADSEGETTATAAIMSVGVIKTGSIDYTRDVDWFKVNLAAGQGYRITARGSDGGGGTLLDPEIIGIYNASGQIFPGSGNDNAYGTLDSETIFTPSSAGYYYVGVKAANDGTGTYSVAVNTSAASNDLPANSTTTAVLQAGSPQSSAIDSAGDIDWIGVNLVAGTSYQIDMLGADSGNGTLLDPVINGVFAAAGGAALAQTADDDSGTGLNAMTAFTAVESGTYYVSVSGYGTDTGTYQLTLQQTGTDTTPPTLLATSPADDSLNVAANTNLSIEFSEAIRAGSGNITITGGGTTRTIAVTDSSQVSFSGSIMTINPSANLVDNTDYTVTFGAGVVRDLVGNSFIGITSNTQFNFHTAAQGVLDDWTVMVYMAADNNLESFGIADINEMESVTLPASVNASVLIDRASGYDDSNGDWSDTRAGTVTHDSNTSSIGSSLTSLGERNTGNGSTLTNFINSTVASNPASHYALIVWDHGGGLSGTSWDDTSNADNLTLPEFVSAVSASTIGHFDFIGFDACLQGMIEQVWDVRNLSDVMVASQELEPGDGWEYDQILGALASNPTSTAFDLANAAVNAYGTRYAGEANITLSATRLSALGSLEMVLDRFIDSAISSGTSILSQLVSAATRATPIDNADSGYRDLGDFMREVIAALPGTAVASSAQEVIAALQSAVLSQVGTIAGANGLSVYLPTAGIDSSYDMQSYSFLQGTGWGNFLRFMLDDQTANYLVGNADANDIQGFGGVDTLIGGGGNDSLDGGSDGDTLLGGDGSDVLDGGSGADSLSGGDGNDYYFVDNAGDQVVESNAGVAGGNDVVYSALAAYTLGANVEIGRIVASGAASLTGNSLANILYAGSGSATLNGAAGNDNLLGGAGVDVLDGGSGADTLSGGNGNDYYFVDNAGDQVVESNAGVAGGNDVVYSALAAYTLGANVEIGRIVASGAASLTGNSLANILYAGSGSATLNGAAGNDNLLGGAGVDVLDGGSGADTLSGGNGNDYYFVDNAGDQVVEANAGVAGGNDVVYSALAAYTLGANVEIGRIVASGAASLTGNGLANVLYAGAGSATLNGAAGNDNLLGGSAVDVLDGGSGADSLSGGDGNDYYFVDNVGDQVIESNAGVAGGNDVVYSALAAYTLGANVEIGRIVASGAASLTGNGLANILYAGAGSATLNGAAGNDNLLGGAGGDVLDGGSGADTLSGSDGNDYYFIDNVGDQVVESNAGVAGGNDVVYSALAAYTLGANVEIGRIVASGAASLTGNGLANLLYAGSGDNVLSGGAGNDTLIGGSGADTFRFDTAPNGTSNLETIGDFSVVDDTIVLENAVFTSLLASGPLAAGAFRAGAGATSAADTDDYLIYNTTTGALYYDAAGNTGDAPVQIALLGSGLALTSADFFVS